MNEDKEESNQEVFSDYLAEFDTIINFDSETCPICGVGISNSLSYQKSPLVLYKSQINESELSTIKQKLESKSITFIIEKRLNSESLEKINYLYDIRIPIKHLTELQKI
jgi:hypothetical protein